MSSDNMDDGAVNHGDVPGDYSQLPDVEPQPRQPKRSPNRFVVDDIIPFDDEDQGDNSCVFISNSKLEQLDLFRGDSVLIKGMINEYRIYMMIMNLIT